MFTRHAYSVVSTPAVWSNWFCLLLVITAATIVCLPFIHMVHSLGMADEGVILLAADRLLRGERLYVDFFEFLPPGSFLITAGWFSLVGTTLWTARYLAIMVIAGIACLIYLTCRLVSRHAALSTFVAIAWLATSLWQGFFVQISHHWFTTLFSMVSAWAALASIERGPRWLRGPMLAGLASGAAVMVTPTRGAAAMLAAATAYLDLRRNSCALIIFVLASAVVPLGMLAYILANRALPAAYDDIIAFPAHRYLSISWTPYAFGWHLRDILVVSLFPLAGLLALATCATSWRTCYRDSKFLTCVAFGFAGWVGFMPRPDLPHIFFAAPLVLPLISLCVVDLTHSWRPLFGGALVVLAMALCLPSGGLYLWAVQRALRADVVSTPRGDVTYWKYITPGAREAVAWLAAAPPQDNIFFYPYLEMLPFLLRKPQISRYDLFVPGYTTTSQYEEACFSMMRQAAWVVIDRNWTDARNLIRFSPAMRDPEPPEKRRFEQALEDGFALVERFGAIEIRHRRHDLNEAACAGISG